MNRMICMRSDGIGSPFNIIVRILFMVSTLDCKPLLLAMTHVDLLHRALEALSKKPYLIRAFLQLGLEFL